MQQKSSHRLIFKLHTKQLKNAKWKFELDLITAMRDYPECVVALNDSQCLRFIDEINGVEDVTPKVNEIYRRIKIEKRKPRSRETKRNITMLYDALYELLFQKDYICIVMDSLKDYDRANEGFTVNGIKYKRLLGTNGGIKNSTIVYVSERVYPELKKRMNNGRDMTKRLVPAKLEAYQALMCSGSIPLPPPKGIIVVKDCITRFKEDVILINDEADGEPVLTHEHDYEFEHNDSDGYGLMSPEYSRKVNGFLEGDPEHTVSGFNSRYAWTKGMVYTVDFVEFAEKVAGSYTLIDVWGCPRDVREADVILTESMLKLWDSYESWEDYKKNCDENHWQFSASKTTPEKLESVRDLNYQFIQDLDLTDEDIAELCQPTFDEINDALGMDYRKSLVFLAGRSLNDKTAFSDNLGPHIKALMANPELINDAFIRRRIWNMIDKRITKAKCGAIRVHGNYAMISGDPYALMESIFGLEVTGLLKAGEVYHKYWIDHGADEIVCFRAPMTVSNNIRKMKLNKSEDVEHWFQHIRTALVYNAWDSACEAMNGADKDGDTNMCTDNPVLIRCVTNKPTIVCVQRRVEKKIPTEDDIIAANKLAFNDDIGIVTNHVTSIIERRAMFAPGSKEYEVLNYRAMCGQLMQQNCIDRAKGVVAKSMPSYWYSYRDCLPKEGDSEEEIAAKEFNRRIVASVKPYFMKYVYPTLKTEHNSYEKAHSGKVAMWFGRYGITTVQELIDYETKSQRMLDFLSNYYDHMPVGNSPCVVNKISWLAEKEFACFSRTKVGNPVFDYSILKSGVGYQKNGPYSKIKKVYEYFKPRQKGLMDTKSVGLSDDGVGKYKAIVHAFRYECATLCSNEDELCDIIVDLCYDKEYSKAFAWNMVGETIVNNLLVRSGGKIRYPQMVDEDGEFDFAGASFKMIEKDVGYETYNFE